MRRGLEGSSTRESSPGLSQTPPKRAPKPVLGDFHQIQCSCDLEFKNILSRSYHSFISRMQTESCWRARNWLKRFPPPRSADKAYSELLLHTLETQQYFDSVKQIELDLTRTYPGEQYYSHNSQGQCALRRVLLAYCKYDTNLGYVQGMNFIAGALLWHATEADAFWLFVGIMEDFELRDIYLPKLPGLTKHCQIIQLLTLELLPRLHLQFAEHRICCEMYATEWCFSLFGSVVPVREMKNVLDNFFRSGWVFFYRFVIAILGCLEERLLEARDSIEVLAPLKICHKSQAEWKQFLAVLDSGKKRLSWNQLIERAANLEIDEDYIKYLHMNFDVDKGQFYLRRVATYH
mmetsp:Transcript_11803/g.17268  ORF Transcript_11803/g.17268 Transcript_11803/m.17268 type:complete len:348 (+) Transcript_11803:32-1075(+)